jgi:hypothetical protein
MAAVGGSSGAGGTTAVGGSGGSAGAGGNSACPAPAIICDDFEKCTNGATDLSPDWIAYTYSGAVKVDTTKPHAGAQSLHLTTLQGAHHYADIIKETPGVELMPLNHYGRMMVWLTSVPPDAQHWNLNMSSGPFPGFPDEVTKYAEGGMFGKLLSNYAQRPRAKNGTMPLLRGGGPETGDAPVDSDCAVDEVTQTIQPGAWKCWEWEFDGPNGTAHLWIDGVAMNEVDAVGHGSRCQGPGFNGVPMTPDYPWDGPTMFDKLIIGWEQYQDNPAEEVWIDDVVISSQRIGCPMP